jgi:hypothetical protein
VVQLFVVIEHGTRPKWRTPVCDQNWSSDVCGNITAAKAIRIRQFSRILSLDVQTATKMGDAEQLDLLDTNSLSKILTQQNVIILNKQIVL